MERFDDLGCRRRTIRRRHRRRRADAQPRPSAAAVRRERAAPDLGRDAGDRDLGQRLDRRDARSTSSRSTTRGSASSSSEKNIGQNAYARAFRLTTAPYLVELDDDVVDAPRDWDATLLDASSGCRTSVPGRRPRGRSARRGLARTGTTIGPTSTRRSRRTASGCSTGPTGGGCAITSRELNERVGGFRQHPKEIFWLEDEAYIEDIERLGYRAGRARGPEGAPHRRRRTTRSSRKEKDRVLERWYWRCSARRAAVKRMLLPHPVRPPAERALRLVRRALLTAGAAVSYALVTPARDEAVPRGARPRSSARRVASVLGDRRRRVDRRDRCSGGGPCAARIPGSCSCSGPARPGGAQGRQRGQGSLEPRGGPSRVLEPGRAVDLRLDADVTLQFGLLRAVRSRRSSDRGSGWPVARAASSAAALAAAPAHALDGRRPVPNVPRCLLGGDPATRPAHGLGRDRRGACDARRLARAPVPGLYFRHHRPRVPPRRLSVARQAGEGSAAHCMGYRPRICSLRALWHSRREPSRARDALGLVAAPV